MTESVSVMLQGIVTRLVVLAMLMTPWAGLAEESCDDPGVVLGFFNGVQTTEDQAKEALEDYLAGMYGPTTPAGHPITYNLFYNDTEGLADFAETFDRGARRRELLAQKLVTNEVGYRLSRSGT